VTLRQIKHLQHKLLNIPLTNRQYKSCEIMSPKIFTPQEKTEREQKILNCAKDIISREGELGLSIDKLVKNLPYSKGTIYNHFTGKEDIILALCTEHLKTLSTVFSKALAFKGNSREKALAIHVGSLLHNRANPKDFMIGVTVKTAQCLHKASLNRRQYHQQLESTLLTPILTHFSNAVNAGECHLPAGMSIEQLAFSCWSVDFGSQVLLIDQLETCSLRSQLDINVELFNSINLLHDGMRWQPLSADFDWRNSIERIKNEVFSDEVAQILLLQSTHINT